MRIDYSRVVHGEERFAHHRPIVAGDRLVGTLHVDGVRQAGGHTMVTTRVELAAEARQSAVSTVISTIVERRRCRSRPRWPPPAPSVRLGGGRAELPPDIPAAPCGSGAVRRCSGDFNVIHWVTGWPGRRACRT